MARQPGIDVNITDNSDEVRRAFSEALEKALMEMGIEAEAHAKEIITAKGAIDTGRLRNSITWAIGGEKANISSYSADRGEGGGTYEGTAPKRSEPAVYIGTNVEYAPWVEAGTSRMAKRPFLRPAVMDFRDEYKEILENNLKNGGNS